MDSSKKIEIVKIGNQAMIEWNAKISSESLQIKNTNKFYGLYCAFTVPTQHMYAIIDDMAYMFGLYKILKEPSKVERIFYIENTKDMIEDENSVMEIAIKESLNHLKYICEIENIPFPENAITDYEAQDILGKQNYLFTGNYFYYYRQYISTKLYLEKQFQKQRLELLK